MQNWQLIFIYFAVGGFFFQIILIISLIYLSKNSFKKKDKREILENIYNQTPLKINSLRNLASK